MARHGCQAVAWEGAQAAATALRGLLASWGAGPCSRGSRSAAQQPFKNFPVLAWPARRSWAPPGMRMPLTACIQNMQMGLCGHREGRWLLAVQPQLLLQEQQQHRGLAAASASQR